MGEAFLAGIEVDGGHALAAFHQRDGDMNRGRGLARTALFVADNNDVSRLVGSRSGLDQHDAFPARYILDGARRLVKALVDSGADILNRG
jgi:hypothetical protein